MWVTFFVGGDPLKSPPMSTENIEQLIAEHDVRTVFQPIIDGNARIVVGHEALTRGPPGSPYESPAALFAHAALLGRNVELEQICIESALRAFRGLALGGRLFINVLPQTLLLAPGLHEWLDERLAAHRIEPHSVVIEITEHGLAESESRLSTAVDPLRRLGCDIAIDDLGAGSSGLKAWAEIRPDYVKVDRYFAAGIELDAVRAEILRAVVEMGRVTGSRVIVEGIETRQQCQIALEQGADYLQGFYLGRPRRLPSFDPGLLAAMEPSTCAPDVGCAEQVLLPVPAIAADTPVAEVAQLLRENPQWSALAVIESTAAPRPLGVVQRDHLLTLLSRPLHPEIYNRKPIVSLMRPAPALIEARARLDQVSRIVSARGEGRENDVFIIVRHGRYAGLGRTIDLLRRLTAQQIQAAMHANPLTGLPGNLQIESQLDQLVRRRRSFIACHVDLDDFKPYNDKYGYARGDQVLVHVAQVLTRAVRRHVDFVGHIGGDDFVCLLRSEDWMLRLMGVFEDLCGSLPNFHSAEHRAAGGFSGRDRDGQSRHFPLLGVSIGATEVDGGRETRDDVLENLRKIKILAKEKPGHCCLVSRHGQMTDLGGLTPRRAYAPGHEAVTCTGA
jgi:EAL domain-containing protein (putative c-di-GMP-specific phosphodiesterase class I)/GGDEF domain-containing protein